MALNDTLAMALSNIWNAEKIGKKDCLAGIASNMLKNVLKIFKENDYIKDFEVVDDGKAGIIKVYLNGNINKCGVVKPRFAVKKQGFEKFEKRYLPAKDMGMILVSTPKGLMTHTQTKENKIGGKLIAYVY
jgi:small subunit ribosomal protein S8